MRILVPTECGETTCAPCNLRDTRLIGVVRHAPFCLVYGRRLGRQKERTPGFGRLTVRCRECMRAEAPK